MKTTLFISVCIISILLSGCNKDNIDYQHSSLNSFSAYPVIADQSIQIFLQRTPKFICGTVDDPPIQYYDPDYCELYSSNNPEGPFNLIYTSKQFSNTGDSCIIKATNDKAYYFYTSSYKKGFDIIQSSVITAIPNNAPKMETLIKKESGYFPNEAISYSSSSNKIAFCDYQNSSDNSRAIFTMQPDGSYSEALLLSCGNPCWDKTGEKLFCANEKGEIIIYDDKTKEVKSLPATNIPRSLATLSPSNNFILYKTFEPPYGCGIALLNLSTMTDTLVFRFTNNQVMSFSWIDDNEFLCSGYDKKYNIYRSNLLEKTFVPFISSDWNDLYPSVSPDKQKIAFYSDRSGSWEVWVYDIPAKSYRQITGYEKGIPLQTNYQHIEWIDNSAICFIKDGNKIVKVTL